MVVDTSALIAIVYAEPDHRRLEQAIEQAGTRLISVASALEASLVMARRAGPTGAKRALTMLDGVIQSLGLTIEPVSVAHLGVARADGVGGARRPTAIDMVRLPSYLGRKYV